MRTLPAFAVLLAIASTVAIHSLAAQEGGASGRGRGGHGGESGVGSSRGAGVEAMRERHAGQRERGADRARGDDLGGQRERRRDHEAMMSPEDRALLADRRGRTDAAARGPRTPEQLAFAQALRDKRRELRAAVGAGTLDRHAAAEQLRAWLRANGPAVAPSP